MQMRMAIGLRPPAGPSYAYWRWRRRVGKALVEECRRRAKRAGAAALGLHTSERLRAGMYMYERLGFVRVPEGDFLPCGAELVMAYRVALDDCSAA